MSSDLTPEDYAFAMTLVDEASAFIRRLAEMAEEAGAEVNLGQVLGAILGVSLSMTPRPLTREEFNTVYDVFEGQFKEALAAYDAVRDYGAGPEATGDAESSHDARALRQHWGEVINTAAFDLGTVPPDGDLADWEKELLADGEPSDG